MWDRSATPDLSEDEESQGRAAVARALEARSTVRYLGIEEEDAIEMAEQTEV